jgi:hypothetical protein
MTTKKEHEHETKHEHEPAKKLPYVDTETLHTTKPVASEKDEPPPTEVGRVHFENAAGLHNGSAVYHVPMALRDRVLLWRHQQHEQNHQNEKGEWVYRLSHDAGVGAVDRDEALEPIDESLTPEPHETPHGRHA